MSFLKNRTVIGVICIVLSLIICFAVTPLFNKGMSQKTEIVRVTKDIKIGDEITKDMVQTVEVGGYNLPEDVVKNTETVLGKFASADMVPGDYIISSKVADEPAAENAYFESFGKKPVPVRSGGSIPIISTFEEVLGIKSILMGFGLESDAIHSPNENFSLDIFRKGIEAVVEFHKEFGKQA